ARHHAALPPMAHRARPLASLHSMRRNAERGRRTALASGAHPITARRRGGSARHTASCTGIRCPCYARCRGSPEATRHLGGDVLVPDWAGWRRERMPAFPNAPYFTQPPDCVCEVVSASTGRVDRSRKMRAYAREGIAHLWLLDPLARTLEVYGLEGGRWVVLA